MNIQERKSELLNRKSELEQNNQRCQAAMGHVQQTINNNCAELLKIEGALAIIAELEAEQASPAPV